MKTSPTRLIGRFAPTILMSTAALMIAANAGGSPVSLWSSNTVPSVLATSSGSARELGVKFLSATNGYITSLRFYKNTNNTGTHIGHLWSSNGTSLASVTFTGETSSGWQQQALTTPVAINSNTTYVVSYYAPSGHYSFDTGYFATSGVTNFPLRAPANNGESGVNGIYRTSNNFPSTSGNGTNFWVDVVFATSIGTDTTAPTIANISPPPGTVTNLSSITVRFSELVSGVDASDLRLNGVPATSVSSSGISYTFTFTPPVAGPATVDWVTTPGISDLASPPNAFDSTAPGANWQYTLIDTLAPVISDLYPPAGATVQSLSQIEVTFSEGVQGVEASDLLINGQPATNLTHVSGGPYVFTFPEPPTGAVSVVWTAGHGITDFASSPNPFIAEPWSYTLDTNQPVSDLVINEILAANVSTNGLADEDGEQQDWIEIYNRGTNSVSLNNWSLSDDPELPGLWTFPARTINPGQYLVVFASGKDRRPTSPSGKLHTNFKLGVGGEFLGLYTPDSPRVLASSITYPEQRNDISYGLNTTNSYVYFEIPTPGAPNGNSTLVGVCDPVHANVKRGYFNTPFDLTLTCDTPGSTVRYTTNGSEPTATSDIFPTSLHVTNSLLLRAAAFKPNYLPSKTATHTYLFNLSAALRSLPALSIVTASNNLWGRTGILGVQGGYFDTNQDGLWVSTAPTDYYNPSNRGIAWERPTSVEWIDPSGNGGFQIDCGIRVHASDYGRPRVSPTSKLSFALFFRSDYGSGHLDYPLFPETSLQSFNQIVVRGGHDDQNNPFTRDELHRRLFADMGDVAVHGSFAVMFVDGVPYTNSPYFNPCERVEKGFFQSYLGGSPNWDVLEPLQSVGGGAIDGSIDNFVNLVNYVNSSNVTLQAVYTNITRWLDVTNFADYLILNTYAAMGDWPVSNWRAARDQATNSLWRFTVWDAEYGMGNYSRSNTMNSFTLNGSYDYNMGLGSTFSQIPQLYQKLKTNPEFKLLWADRVQKHFFNGGALTPANITNRFVEMRTQLASLISNMDTSMLQWAATRQPIYFSQMSTEGLLASKSAPILSQFGGRIPVGFTLTLTQTNSGGGNTIYYTLDGSDPRVPFTGGVSGTASSYSSPIPLNSSVTVKARVKQSSNWSALTEATFTYASLGSPLRITELMYNPTGGSVYEFLELLNTSASPVDLSGDYFGGITYIFPVGATLAPGARLVLGSVTDTNAWAARYPSVHPFGWYAGNLSNSGERIELFDASGNLITSVDYSDSNGWPTAADGSGNSLEVVNPNGDPDNPANWQASAATNGTPGAANSSPAASTIRLNEVMADNQTAVNNSGTYPDWVELFNSGSNAVSIANWSLTDNGNARQFVFPGGTMVPANGYLVVWCDDTTNTTPGLHTGFNLSKNGEAVYLFDANTNRIDALGFGLQVTDYSVGRLSGAWTLTTPTPNATNVAATFASVTNLAINEWMANPVAGQSDWLELFNRSATAPVSLQGLYLATSNNLFQLAALSFLPPKGYAQLLADNGVGPTHLDFHLSASGDQIVLYDNTGSLIQQVAFGTQTEGVSSGRLPDGTSTITNFPGTASPGTTNYTATYTGPVLNEVLAHNSSVLVNGLVQDFIELHNPGGTAFDLGGMSLSADKPDAGKWIFPSNTLLAANGYLVIPCDGTRPASTNAGSFNLGSSLNGMSGGAYLFNAAGQLVDSAQHGPQIRDLSIGLSSGQWKLLSTPTPGTANAAPATLGTNLALRINEWMASPLTGADWFELYNTSTQAVDLSTISLSDDPSITGVSEFRPAPLSFIAGHGFVKWTADNSPGQGLDHVNFALDGKGDSLLLYGVAGASYSLIDAVAFGAQPAGVSAGRLPDGNSTFTYFPGSPTPAESNYRLIQNVWINELLTHTDPPLEDAIELFNPTATPVDISGWYLSDSKDNFRKFQIPSGTIIPTNGFATFYEYQFNSDPTNGFAFSSAYGDQFWLSVADSGGNETGDRLEATFGASFNGQSFGRVATSVGVDYARVGQPTFGVSSPASLEEFRTGTGATNGAPVIGPIVINEIHYHPPSGTNEFVELYNNSANTVPLYDPAHSTNHWRLGDGIGYTFPAGVSMAPGTYLLVVDFDPTNTTALAGFRSLYGVSPSIPVYGPFSDSLDNSGDEVGLYQPDNPQLPTDPDAGYVPYVRVDYVNYTDAAPWPIGAVDGGGLSLQRSSPYVYGNEPINWFASAPTPGSGVPDAPPVAFSQSVTNAEDASLALTLAGYDVDGPVANFIIVTNPAHGILTGTAPNLIYTPNTNYFGPDSLAFQINDGTLTSAVAVVNITITGIDDTPLAFNQSLTNFEDTPLDITLTGSDVDGPILNFVVVTNPMHGTLSGTAPNLTYTPDADYFGPDSLAFQVDDGLLTSAVATVSLTITNVNDAPVAVPDTLTRWMSQGVTTPIATLLSNDTDIDGDTLTLLSVTNPAPFGAAIIQSNNLVVYRPPFGDTNAGSFDYIISDGNGGSATGFVTVATMPDPVGTDVLAITAEPGAGVTLNLTGIPDFTYTVQFTDALTPPNWQNLTNATADGSGLITVGDSMPLDSTNRFYRAVRGIAP